MFKIFLTEPIHPSVLSHLKTEADVFVGDTHEPRYVIEQLRHADAVILRTRGGLTKEILQEAPRLRVIGKHGVGLDNVDVAAAKELGIPVVYTPDANLYSVAEHAVGMLLSLARNFIGSDRAVRSGDWQIRERQRPRELRDKIVGLVGAGRIGSQVGMACHHAFAMNVVYYDTVPNPGLEEGCGALRVPLSTLCQKADFISVHLPLTEATRGLIGRDLLSMMKPSAYVVNVGRGGIIDEDALAEALRSKQIAGAGLDVFAQEPMEPNHPFVDLDNVLLTPHTAGLSEESSERMARTVVDDVLRVLRGQPPRYPAP